MTELNDREVFSKQVILWFHHAVHFDFCAALAIQMRGGRQQTLLCKVSWTGGVGWRTFGLFKDSSTTRLFLTRFRVFLWVFTRHMHIFLWETKLRQIPNKRSVRIGGWSGPSRGADGTAFGWNNVIANLVEGGEFTRYHLRGFVSVWVCVFNVMRRSQKASGNLGREHAWKPAAAISSLSGNRLWASWPATPVSSAFWFSCCHTAMVLNVSCWRRCQYQTEN